MIGSFKPPYEEPRVEYRKTEWGTYERIRRFDEVPAYRRHELSILAGGGQILYFGQTRAHAAPEKKDDTEERMMARAKQKPLWEMYRRRLEEYESEYTAKVGRLPYNIETDK